MRGRRLRGFGCLGCLPFGGLLVMLLPVIAIAAIIYFLVNRQRPAPPVQPYPPQPYNPPPAVAAGGFCPRCGAATTPGARFCPGCGGPLS